jgi:16S rRNA (cytidine1402-2'-O)-methyltransferase
LQDLSPRAQEILAEVDVIWAEDTRHSRKLLNHFGIDTPTRSLHDHNEKQLSSLVCDRVEKGENCALISDAGTPLISDPGFVLVREAHARGIKISPIPGPSAAITALSASGLPSDRFVFEGFLPAKSTARRNKLKWLAAEHGTLIFYESPRRLGETIDDMVEVFGGERRVVIARELTKLYETIRQMTLEDLKNWLIEDQNQSRGELVILLEGNHQPPGEEVEMQIDRLLSLLAEELPIKQAATLAAKLTGKKKNALYEQLLKLKEE